MSAGDPRPLPSAKTRRAGQVARHARAPRRRCLPGALLRPVRTHARCTCRPVCPISRADSTSAASDTGVAPTLRPFVHVWFVEAVQVLTEPFGRCRALSATKHRDRSPSLGTDRRSDSARRWGSISRTPTSRCDDRRPRLAWLRGVEPRRLEGAPESSTQHGASPVAGSPVEGYIRRQRLIDDG
jgi:hypothetical protein